MDVFSKAVDLIVAGDTNLILIVILSLRVSITAVCIASVFAIPLGTAISMGRFWGRQFILSSATALMALPPVVVGLAVYLLLSRSGPLGDFGLLFTPTAMIIAQSILIFPIITALTVEAVNPINQDYKPLLEAINTPRWMKLWTLIVDARFAIITAILAGLGRALAEVGAVIIVGGNINGVTRVMTTTIALETSKGNLELALALGLVLIAIAFSLNFAIHAISDLGKKYQVTRT